MGALIGGDGKIRPANGTILPTDADPPDRRTYYNFRLGKLRPRPSDQETPPGLARFLYETISPVYDVQTILDPCAGRRAMTKPWRGRRVISFEIEAGRDFFECPNRIECNLVLCNPPFSQDGESTTGYQPERFLRQIVEVVPAHTNRPDHADGDAAPPGEEVKASAVGARPSPADHLDHLAPT